VPAGGHSERDAALRAVRANPVWYHTLELPGAVTTPGQVDLRRVAPRLLPPDLRGKRALDVGTFDGFWAFELERRGAEVVAIDLGGVEQVQLAPTARAMVEEQARARGVECDVLELEPATIGGTVDLAFMGALLVHLRDPVRGLERIRSVLAPGGELYQLEAMSMWLSLLHPRQPVAHLQTLTTSFNWWFPNWAMLRTWLMTAGFDEVHGRGIYRPPQRRPMRNVYRGIHSRRS